MKKNLKLMLAVIIAAFTFASCSDVPCPYGLFADDSGELEGATGTGTLEDPFNVPAAINYIKKLEPGVNSDQVFYIKGIVSQLVEGQNFDAGFGNGTFYISVDGEARNQFCVYRSLYLENKTYTNGPIANVGDEVVICGKVVLHGGTTPETVEKEAYLYSLNGETKYEVREFGTKDKPLTVAEALQIINGLENGETIGNGYIKGKVSTAATTISSGKLTYYISDDGTTTNQIQIYKGLGLNKDKFSAVTDLAVGDEVVIYGPMTKYTNGSPEINDGNYLISLTKGQGGGGGTGDPLYTISFKSSTEGWTVEDKVLPSGFSHIWINDTRYGFVAKSYNNPNNYDGEGWLISPKIDLSKASSATLKFKHAGNYFESDAKMKEQIAVLVSTDGTNWTPLEMTTWPTYNKFTWVETSIDLASYLKANVQIAFKYIGTSTKAGTWEIEYVTIQ